MLLSEHTSKVSVLPKEVKFMAKICTFGYKFGGEIGPLYPRELLGTNTGNKNNTYDIHFYLAIVTNTISNHF